MWVESSGNPRLPNVVTLWRRSRNDEPAGYTANRSEILGIVSAIPVFRDIGNVGLIYFSGKSPEAIANAVRIVPNRNLALSISKPKTLTWTESFANFAKLL